MRARICSAIVDMRGGAWYVRCEAKAVRRKNSCKDHAARTPRYGFLPFSCRECGEFFTPTIGKQIVCPPCVQKAEKGIEAARA